MKKKVAKPPRCVRGPAASYCQPGGEIVLYQAADGRVQLEVRLERETIWLSLNQMAALFDRDKSVISRHLRNIYREGELDRGATVAFFATVQQEGGRTVSRQVEYYNLDAIIAVGYRVNSKRGTQFRIWATGVLHDHILKGYTVNAQRLAALQQTIRLISNVVDQSSLGGDEAAAMLRVLRDYADALNVLDAYDHGKVPEPEKASKKAEPISLEEARRVVAALREHFGGSGFFGREKDDSLDSSIAAIFQTVDGHELYPSIEEKAAHLLYFVVKNHPFLDGYKRIGAAYDRDYCVDLVELSAFLHATQPEVAEALDLDHDSPIRRKFDLVPKLQLGNTTVQKLQLR
ncbi:virulence protein RhuM/Fic/DOC family protein [Desulfoglaeba alkanexedens]|uniref:Fic/DOC family protein n=1 Tax=Desulfoglaeba alkanexedens ALDC TaxID=980445 RepID=A0A4P8L301_9BACT|nr:virulence protein RhuM/Fic/DOC family protein [Desulfoglaeba alkanexedens]QCQ22124.1 Fic/DOC family protein [Desulfoglaeba alkanexedens ALDC]